MVKRVLVLPLVFLPGLAFATPSVGGGVQSTTSIINRIVNSTPGLNTITTTGTGVTVRGAASTAVGVGRGVTVAVPTTAEVAVGAGRIAGVAARAIKWGSWVGVASVVIPWLVDQSGVKVCPAPDFFCKPGPDQGVEATGTTGYNTLSDKGSVYGGTGQMVCDKYFANSTASDKGTWGGLVYVSWNGTNYPFIGKCVYGVNGGFKVNVNYVSPTCPAGSITRTNADGSKSCVVPGPDVPATETDVGNAVESVITGKPERVGQLYKAETGAGLAVMAPTDPVTVTAPSVVSSPTVVTTETVPNPDGTLSTVKKETKTDVKPAVSGSNLGGTSISYPTTTTTTTTTTNNTTNVTTVTTSITNNYGAETVDQPTPIPVVKPPVTPDPGPAVPGQPGAPGTEIPTDYNREVTQQKILQQLDGSTAPAAPADQEARTQTEIAKTDKSLDDKLKAIPGEINGDKTNWFSWVWTPPVGQCSASMFSGTVHGFSVNWDICVWVERIRDCIGFLFALYGAINIYGNLFKKGND